MPEAYYRAAADAAPMAAYLEDVKQRHHAFYAARDAFLAEMPAGAKAVVRKGWGTEVMVGVSCDEQPGPLWMQKRGDFYWSPIRKSAAGKKLAERLEQIRLDLPGIPGTPDFVVAGLRMCSAGLMVSGDTCWLTWSCSPDEVEREPKFDASLWQRVKASEYYRAKEEAEEQAAERTAAA